jgi:hypothetical protein
MQVYGQLEAHDFRQGHQDRIAIRDLKLEKIFIRVAYNSADSIIDIHDREFKISVMA